MSTEWAGWHSASNTPKPYQCRDTQLSRGCTQCAPTRGNRLLGESCSSGATPRVEFVEKNSGKEASKLWEPPGLRVWCPADGEAESCERLKKETE